jgi:phage baseplate assembly protein W
MNQEKSFLGTGWSFPPTFNRLTGDVQMVSDRQDIRQSLLIYLNTQRGERLMRLKYGSVISDHLFDSTGQENLSILCERLKNDIRLYEPRIIVVSVQSNSERIADGVVVFSIHYEIQSTNIRDNIVYPFYLTEGTHVL